MEIAVVGAGPAGAWSAYSLARRGARVTIFDPSHPREKPCGGGVTARALALVADASATTNVPRTTIRSARFITTGTRATAVVGRVPSDPACDGVVSLDAEALVVASRASFDAALLAAAAGAGATLVAARVTDIAVHGDGVTIETTGGSYRADFVIGADGANSLVRRRVARAFRRNQLSIATGFFAHGVTSDEIVIDLMADPPGYIWSFPRPDHLAIGICAQADTGATAGSLREITARWITTIGIAGPGPSLQAYSWPIPSLDGHDLGRLELAGPRWCLVGDAAGLVDPITREGIFFALESGQWAADSLAGTSGASSYAARVRDEMIPELARAARFRAGFFRPAFIALLIDALQQSAEIRAVVADLIAGRQPYDTLKWRLLKTFELGLALRSAKALAERHRA